MYYPQPGYPPYGAPPPAYVHGQDLVVPMGAQLPGVCMKCGATSSLRWRDTSFRYTPPWIYIVMLVGCPGLVLGAILSAALSRTARAMMPLCPTCESRWSTGEMLKWLSAGGFVCLALGLPLLGILTDSKYVLQLLVAGFFGGIILLVVVLLAVTQPRTVRATNMDNFFMWLRGVHPAAKQAACQASAGQAVAQPPGQPGYGPPPAALPPPGPQRVLVRGPDGNEYPGTVVSRAGGQVQVTFANGSSTWLPEASVRPGA